MKQDGGSGAARKAAAQDSAQRFRTLFEQAPFSVQLVAPDGRVLLVNRAWRTLRGLSGDEQIQRDCNILDDPQLRDWGVLPSLRRALAGEPLSTLPLHYEPARRGQTGRARWLVLHAHPIFDEDGRVCELLLIQEDVTERQETELHLRQAEERLRLATEAGNIGIWEWDMAADHMEWSERVYRLHGIWPSQFGGRIGDFLKLVHPEDLPRLRQAADEAINGSGHYFAEFRALLPDGDVRWLSTWARIHKDDDGKPNRMVGATISIDAWKKAEEALKDGDRRKDEFLAMLAHELRNPLAPISTAAQLLCQPALEREKQRQAGEIIARQVTHLTELVDDLLDVSRVTRGLVTLDREMLDVKTLVASAIEQVRPLIEARGHALGTCMASAPLFVEGDRTRLVQVLVNILNNAAKYTPPGGLIQVKAEAEDGQLRLSVADNGIGIEASLVPRVFELFLQAKRTPDRSLGGLGIGLPLVKSLMKLHGGRVEASSPGPGRGSTFTLVLPLVDGTPPPAPAPEQDALAPAARGLRILVVDDNLDAASTLATLLELKGHAVTVKTDATSALAVAEELAPQVLILDIGLPDLDGFSLARRLRALPALRDALFIALTGYGQPQDRAQSKEAGFDHHFVKPLDTQALDAVLAAGR